MATQTDMLACDVLDRDEVLVFAQARISAMASELQGQILSKHAELEALQATVAQQQVAIDHQRAEIQRLLLLRPESQPTAKKSKKDKKSKG